MASLQAQPTGTIHGVIVDAGTGAPIAGARVELSGAGRSIQTAADGRFEFAGVALGRQTVTVSIIGYIFVRREVDVRPDEVLELTIPLTEGVGTYQETVSVTPPPAKEVGVGSQADLGSAALQDLRGVAADDPMRAVQALPGVATGDDFQSQFSVRGSQFRHVGIVLDGTATPLLLHTVRSTNDTASIAMINTDVLDRASLLAGAHPQRHGDWLGATLEFGLREGSRDRAQVRGVVSATTASMVVEGPLGRSKRGSWLASVRQSYIDWLVRRIYPSIDGTLGFSDVQSKFGYDLTSRQHAEFVLIAGDSGFLNENASLDNGIHTANSKSVLGSAAWRYSRPTWMVSQRASFVGSQFADRGRVDQTLGSGYARSLTWRGDATASLGGQWSIETGGKFEAQRQTLSQHYYRLVKNVPIERASTSSDLTTDLAGGWIDLTWRHAKTGVSGGARATRDSLSRQTIASPWLLAEQTIGRVTLRASTGESHQFPELEIQRGLADREPERADMADLGFTASLPLGMSVQATGFWRHEAHVIRQAGEAQLAGSIVTPESIFPEFAASLDGRTRGVDLVFSRRAASGLTGWIAYTFAHTRDHDVQTDETFDGDFDQRHTLNVFLQERLSYRTAISAKLRLGSNFPMVGYYSGTLDALTIGSQRNQVRLPAYARLDIRANRTYTFQTRRLTLFIELVNATGHDNLGQRAGSISGIHVLNPTQKLLPFIPSAGILVEF